MSDDCGERFPSPLNKRYSVLRGYVARKENTDMKSTKFLHVSLVVGLVLGLMALWVGASPIGTSGDLVTGGWTTCWAYDDGWNIVAATSWDCDPCQGTLTRYCYEYDVSCNGGSISVVMVTGGPGNTPHSAGYAPCTEGACEGINAGSCY